MKDKDPVDTTPSTEPNEAQLPDEPSLATEEPQPVDAAGDPILPPEPSDESPLSDEPPQATEEVLPVDLFGIVGVEVIGNGFSRFKAKDWSGATAEFVLPDAALSQKIVHQPGANLDDLFALWVYRWKV